MESINLNLEHVLLHPHLSHNEVERAVGQAVEFKLGSICLPPFWAKKASRDLKGVPLQLVVAVGYPFGYQMTESKVQQINQAIENGADEIQVSLNLSAFKSGMPWVKIELAKCAQLIHRFDKTMSVHLDCQYLNFEELDQLSKICTDAGTDYITVMLPSPDAVTVASIRDLVPNSVGLKIQGQLANLEEYQQLLISGVDRLCGNILQILAQRTV